MKKDEKEIYDTMYKMGLMFARSGQPIFLEACINSSRDGSFVNQAFKDAKKAHEKEQMDLQRSKQIMESEALEFQESYNEGYEMARKGEHQLLNMLLEKFSKNNNVRRGWLAGKEQFEKELRQKLQRHNELQQAMNPEQNQNDLER